ncbi:MAG TPA: glycerol-3-phosphate dehydrogenase/oxidase [Candidatus Thermoplasmatota archaeon]|nr:glycerol-3-phosphate dehydrogenase/oxidase [Candidatus Thermoplasmatota archaeon]
MPRAATAPPGPPRIVRDVARLGRDEFDVLVVGGGINGTGVARDAARRGLKVALVEREDYGYGTTGRSTRLVHGGLRYLEQGEFGLVRESLRERERLLRAAPHLVQPLRFLLPLYEGAKPAPWRLRLGLLLYDVLSFDKSLPSRGWLPRERALAEEPALAAEGLRGAGVYHDAQITFVERLCVENALDAAAHGASLVNHCEVTGFLLKEGRVTGATVRDRLSGGGAGDDEAGAADEASAPEVEVRAGVVVDATGPWMGGVTALKPARVRRTKGIHVLVAPAVRNAIVLFAPDGRLFFAIPFVGHTLVGTTDTDYQGDLDDVHADAEDVAYLRASAARYLPHADLEDVLTTWAGVRSLVAVQGVSESAVTRKHLVVDHHKTEGVGGLISIVGGKITPYRNVAERTVDLVAKKIGKRTRCDTRRALLPGAPFGPWAQERGRVVEGVCRLGLASPQAERLADLYGQRAPEVAAPCAKDASLAKPVCEHAPDAWCEVLHAVREEGAVTAADVVFRRTGIGLAPCAGRDAAEPVARFLAPLLGWDAAREKREAAAVLAEVDRRGRWRTA